MTEQVPHRPGPFKLPNKAHKPGRHRTNRQINRENRGRTDVKMISRRIKRSTSRHERRNIKLQQRKVQRQSILEQNRNLSRAPYLVTVISFDEQLDAARVIERLAGADPENQMACSDRGNITYLNVPRFRARFGFVCPVTAHVENVLDCLKVSDIVLFAWPLDGTLSSEQDILISVIMAHGLPSHVNVVSGLPDKGKQRDKLRQNVTSLVDLCNLTTDRLLNLDNEQDGLQVLRQLQAIKKQHTVLQQRRPHLMVEKMERTDVKHGVCTLKVSGFLRGPTLDANRLVHIQGFGDFQLEQIERARDPHPGSKDNNFESQVLKPDENQYDLQTEVIPDPMDAEQPDVDDMLKPEEVFKKPVTIKKVPKGTSSYQAAWILDDDEDDEEGSGEDESGEDDEDDDSMDEEEDTYAPHELKGPGFFDEDERDMDLDAMTVGTLGNEEFEDMEMDMGAVEKFRRERENAQFPDEVDTPVDRSAAERFQKYRGLKSFRTSPWDSKENLPFDYARIFKFGNMKHTKKLILKELEAEPTPNQVVHGDYVVLHIKDVPAHIMTEWGEDMPMVVYGLLKHEQRMSLLNVVLRRHASFTSPIKNKDVLIYHIGFRRFEAGAVFSQHTIGDKFKMERFMPVDDTPFVASMYAPVMFPPSSVLVFRRDLKGNQQLVASGTVLDNNPDRIVLKRVVLSGHPIKVQRRTVIARYMFFRPEDIEWFKPIEVYTPHGRRGHIKQAIGTHGHMKCVFDQPVGKQDLVMMNLYKRAFPKWDYNPRVQRPKPIGGGMINARSLIIAEIRDIDVDPLESRDFATCSSGVRGTAVSIGSLVESGNEMTDRLIIVFATLIAESNSLVEQAKEELVNNLLLYGEDPEGILEHDGGCVMMIANFLPTLQDIGMFVTRCYEVVVNILNQLHAFFNLPEQSFNKAAERLMMKVWKALSDLLVVLIQVDEILRTHPTLTEHWSIYAKTMRMVQHNPAQFNAVDERFKALTSIIANLDAKLMSGFVFQNCYDQGFPSNLTTDKAFLQRFQKILIDTLTRWEKESTEDWPNKNKLVGIFGLTILFTKIASNNLTDKKFIKNLCGTYKKLPGFQFAGDVHFVPVEFFVRHFPDAEKMAEKKILQNVTAAKDYTLENLCEMLPKELSNFVDAVAEWKSEMKNIKTAHDFQNSTHQFLSFQCMLILKGAKIADRISRLVKSVLSGHLNTGKTLLKSNVYILFRMIELIKIVSATTKFYWPSILEWCFHANQYWSGCVLRILEAVKSQAGTDTSTKNLDWISTLLVAENSVSVSVTKQRLIICGTALEVGNYTKSMRAVDCVELDDLLSRLDTVESIGSIFKRVTNCSFVYWHRSLLEIYMENIFGDQQYSVEQVSFLMEAIQDGASYLKNVKHESVEKLERQFREEIYELIEKLVLDKLSTKIENDLRLEVHSKQNQTVNELEEKLFSVGKKPKQPNIPTPNQVEELRCKQWLNLRPLKIAGQVINIKRHVEFHLERTFYNLTAVALHDGETYVKMRQLAKHRYGLVFAENKLPYMTIDQGLDVLMIMKNLHVFVVNYNYDLNEQMFMERSGKNRSLNVMYVQQVVNSIKTHGVGIVNSAVNYAYQFLKKKFHIFSQFLFDDQIKYQLVKEIKFYRDSIDDLNQMYPVKRAEKFNTAIAKLGVSSDGKTFLDKFRELITQIGNTIGFIRMVRSGAIESSAYASHFIPKLHLTPKSPNGIPDDPTQESTIAALFQKLQASPRSVEIAESVDALISNFADSFGNENDYVEMLIAVFAKEFRNYDKFAHLRNFFIIIPPLTINYVEYILSCRSKLGRRAQSDEDFTFVDDGFCLGIAYILTLLNQTYFFDSLNWFESVFDKFDTEIGRAQEEQKAAQKRKDESFAQTLSIKIQRLDDLQKEFRFLMYTMHSATMLFKIKDHENPDDDMYLEDF